MKKISQRALCQLLLFLLLSGVITQGAHTLAITHESGFFKSELRVGITVGRAGATIYYTTNGATPTSATGAVYEGPIVITSTTVLRATSGDEKKALTRSFIFVEDVLKQTGAGFPVHWGWTNGQPVLADYEMDREITSDPTYAEDLKAGLISLPSLSIVTDLDTLFGRWKGIYANPMESGEAWERAASAEMIYRDGKPGFQIQCGLRIQGGWNRRPEECPKHSLRLVFKKKYGSAKLKFPLFGRPGVSEFDTMILRGGCNNTWLHWSGEERRRGDYIRDQWMRQTFADMGQVSARGIFVHLYLNGLYWGVYNLCERPDERFLSATLGGAPEDYDSRNGSHILAGDTVAWDKMMALVNGSAIGEREYRDIQQYLDVTNFVDYMILNFYGGNGDWDAASNWYAGRRRDGGKFQFFVWDGERTLEDVNANTMSFDDDQSPPRLFQKLRGNPEFRRLFAERVKLHLTNGGALTAAATAARFRNYSEQLDKAIAAESARWGDYRRDVHRYKTGPYELHTRNEHWRPEMRRISTEYFPWRAAVLLAQFREAGLASAE